mgnify:CR=1 FL=1
MFSHLKQCENLDKENEDNQSNSSSSENNGHAQLIQRSLFVQVHRKWTISVLHQENFILNLDGILWRKNIKTVDRSRNITRKTIHDLDVIKVVRKKISSHKMGTIVYIAIVAIMIISYAFTWSDSHVHLRGSHLNTTAQGWRGYINCSTHWVL